MKPFLSTEIWIFRRYCMKRWGKNLIYEFYLCTNRRNIKQLLLFVSFQLSRAAPPWSLNCNSRRIKTPFKASLVSSYVYCWSAYWQFTIENYSFRFMYFEADGWSIKSMYCWSLTYRQTHKRIVCRVFHAIAIKSNIKFFSQKESLANFTRIEMLDSMSQRN